jgi:hypothetical protein
MKHHNPDRDQCNIPYCQDCLAAIRAEADNERHQLAEAIYQGSDLVATDTQSQDKPLKPAQNAQPDTDTRIDSLLVEFGWVLQRYSPEDADRMTSSYRQAHQAIKDLIADQVAAAGEHHDRELMSLMSDTIELLKTCTPARPEDLSQSQWYGLVEGIVAATATLENGLAELRKGQK